MPVPNGNGLPEQNTAGPPTTYLLGQQPFQPPRVVSGNLNGPPPRDGRVTRELSPDRGVDGSDSSNGTGFQVGAIPENQVSVQQRQEHIELHSELTHLQLSELAHLQRHILGEMVHGSMSAANGQPQNLWGPALNSGNDVSPPAMQHANTLPINGHAPPDVFQSYQTNTDMPQHQQSLPEQMPVNGNGNGNGPLPNPSFVFGDVHNESSTAQVTNYPVDERYLAMQDRSRINSMASIGTYVSEVPTEMSDFSGGYDYINQNPAGDYDAYSRRSSA